MIRDSEKRPHERLDVWQDAMMLVEAVYRLTAVFPDNERFGLVAQMRRAVISIPSDIAEGAARRSTAEYLRFLSIARGSLAELDTQLQISTRLDLATPSTEIEETLHRTFARLNALLLAEAAERSALFPIPNPQSPIPAFPC